MFLCAATAVFPFKYSSLKFSVLCVFGLFSECAQCFGMIGDHIFHIGLIKVIARKTIELIQRFLVIGVWARWGRQILDGRYLPPPEDKDGKLS
jgi:hypothetical protein